MGYKSLKTAVNFFLSPFPVPHSPFPIPRSPFPYHQCYTEDLDAQNYKSRYFPAVG
ncbi:hypothetical protein FDUTEX481_09161 [Tolypothrix sp. PCC 7601]|nr:hypothetical protein FDUTEX481_09161 [Tolypothrix sp. PCC 7601]